MLIFSSSLSICSNAGMPLPPLFMFSKMFARVASLPLGNLPSLMPAMPGPIFLSALSSKWHIRQRVWKASLPLVTSPLS